MSDDQLSESTNVWLRFKAVFGGQTTSFHRRRQLADAAKHSPATAEELPFGPHRDPVSSGDLLASLFRRNDWTASVANARVLDAWPQIAGEKIARHAKALHIDDRVLVVQCDSTAWATQLRALRGSLVQQIIAQVPGAELDDLRVLNPGAPSWRYGKWSVPGRGPRDTYG